MNGSSSALLVESRHSNLVGKDRRWDSHCGPAGHARRRHGRNRMHTRKSQGGPIEARLLGPPRCLCVRIRRSGKRRALLMTTAEAFSKSYWICGDGSLVSPFVGFAQATYPLIHERGLHLEVMKKGCYGG